MHDAASLSRSFLFLDALDSRKDQFKGPIMVQRPPRSKLFSAIIVAAALAVLGGAGMLARAPHYSQARDLPRPTASTAPSTPGSMLATSTEPASAPAVAGAATTAPNAITPQPGAAKTPTTPTPTIASTINLTLIDPDGTFNYIVRLSPDADACTVLEQARTEGKISSLDIDYSYLKTHLKSAYVRSINTFTNNWTVKVNGTAPLGCSLVRPQNNDNVTWRYQ